MIEIESSPDHDDLSWPQNLARMTPAARSCGPGQARLKTILASYGSICVGYSGGVDSTLLAWMALQVLGKDRLLAVTGISASYPRVQRDLARTVAAQFGIPQLEIETEEMTDPAYVANDPGRCYHCKSELWSKLVPLARARGLAVVADGSNLDDRRDHRPGARAGRELGVRSPLAEAGLGKDEIRVLSRAAGLPTWDLPAAPCLSSRIAYGMAVTPERLEQVEEAEEILRQLGFREFRVRHHGTVARVEVAPDDREAVIAVGRELAGRIRALGFRRVLLDVEGYRRGSLNEGLRLVQLGGHHG